MILTETFDKASPELIARELIDVSGCYILTNVFEPAVAEQMIADSKRLDLIDRYNGQSYKYENNTRVMHATRSLAVETLSKNERLVSIMRACLGAEPKMGRALFSVIDAGSNGMSTHRDFPCDVRKFRLFPKPVTVHCIFALGTFKDNGTTMVAPGTQKPNVPDGIVPTVPFEASAGSVLIMHGNLIHGCAPNPTQSDRYALQLTYTSLAIIRPGEMGRHT